MNGRHIARLTDEDARRRRIFNQLEAITRTGRCVARAGGAEYLLPGRAEDRVIEIRRVGSGLDVQNAVHAALFNAG